MAEVLVNNGDASGAVLALGPNVLLLDVKETARLLSVSPRTVAELTRLRKLPHVRLQRRVLYPLDKIRDYINSITEGGLSR